MQSNFTDACVATKPLAVFRFAVIVGLVTLLASLGRADDATALEAGRILKRYCFRCHSGDGADSGYAFDVTKAQSLIDQDVVKTDESVETNAKGEKKSKADRSSLFALLSNGQMPPKNQPHLPRPSPDEAKIVERWINEGAVEIPKPQRREFISIEKTLESIRDHYKTLPIEDRRNVRYFTLVNLWNDTDVDLDHLRTTRAALSKVLNSLSWSNAIELPKAIDPNKLIFAVDTSRLGWTRDHWIALIESYPYGLAYGSHSNPALKKLSDELTFLANRDSQLLHLRADWFISTATKPQLYHKLLYELVIPDLIQRKADLKTPNNPKHMTDLDLETFLKVNVAGNLFSNPPSVLRAGFVKSGISGQNRMIEMHRLTSGRVYWKSYDFLASNREAILAQFPLGPPNANNKHNSLAFKHDGGEIIFTLPNGLQGYLLATGAGGRLDAGPIEIVGDSLRTSGNQTIVNGLSCIACHRNGMVEPPQDEIRKFASTFGDARRRVEELYVESEKMNSEISRINQAFIVAAKQATESFLTDGVSVKLDFERMPEPVAEVSRRFLLEAINLETVACELDEAEPKDLEVLIRRSSELQSLGISILTKEAGAIKRDAWESKAAYSLMQETARELGFTPR